MAKKQHKNKELPENEGVTPGGMVKNRRLTTLQDLRRLLGETINQCRRGEISEGKARVLGYLCSVTASVVKDSDLEGRIEALERLMEAER